MGRMEKGLDDHERVVISTLVQVLELTQTSITIPGEETKV